MEKYYYYDYKMLEVLKCTPKEHENYNWHLKNFLGEVYEYFVYELLIEKYRKITDVKFILKGPYIKSDIKEIWEGFKYNKKNEIYYFCNKETIAEYDALIIGKDKVLFYEITRASNKASYIVLRNEIIRKISLLKLLFDRSVECIIITPKNHMEPIGKYTIENIEVPIFDLDLRKFNKKKIDRKLPKHFIYLNEVQCNTFNYFDTVIKLYTEFCKTKDLEYYYSEIKRKYDGLIERLFLGINKRNIYFLKLKPLKKISNPIKVVSKKNCFYELSRGKRIKIESKKRTYKDIIVLRKHLKEIKNLNGILKSIKNINETL